MKLQQLSTDEFKKWLNGSPNVERHAYLVKADGSLFIVHPTANRPARQTFTLEELQALVSGYIEIYPQSISNRALLVDEEGLLKPNYVINKTIFDLFSITVVGDVVIVNRGILGDRS
jgi:hypothetical protein